MKLPRVVSGEGLARALERLGHRITRQMGSHIRLTFDQPPQHHVTVPAHPQLEAGSLSAIMSLAAGRLHMTKEQLLTALKL